jgi:hypothetical protein
VVAEEVGEKESEREDCILREREREREEMRKWNCREEMREI